MINPISTRPPELSTIQDATTPTAPAEQQPKTNPADDGIQPAQTPADGEVVINKDIGGILQDIGNIKFPTLPPSGELPTIDLPPSSQGPGPLEPTTVRFPTKG